MLAMVVTAWTLACPGQRVVLAQDDPAPATCGADPSCPTDAGYARLHAEVCVRETTLTTASGECTLRLAHPIDDAGEWPDAAPLPFVVHAHGASQAYTGYDELLTHWAANGIVGCAWDNPLASTAGDNTVGPAAEALLECLEALRLGADAVAAGDPWTPEDAAHLDRILGLSGHSFGGAVVREAARFLGEADPELELRAVSLLAPRRVASPLETAPRSYFNHAMAPALLVVAAGMDDDVPDDAHPYADRSSGEGSFFGGADVRTTVSFVWAPRARHHPFMRLDDPDEDDPSQRLLARAYSLALFDHHLRGDARFASRLRGEVVDASLDASPNMPIYLSYMQGSRIIVDGEPSDAGAREVIANFEPGDPEAGTWALAEGSAGLELDVGRLDSLDIGRAYFDGALDDQATCEDAREGADACPLPQCGPCQTYADRHLGEDGTSTSGLRVRYDELDAPARLLIEVPEHLRDFGDAQILSLEVAVNYLDSRNTRDGGRAKDLRVGLRDAAGGETPLRRLSELGPRTVAGEASVASPGAIPYPVANIQSASGLMGEQDLTITTLRTYRVALGELCSPGFDAREVAAIVIELGGVDVEALGASGALLFDGVALERSPDALGLATCGAASPPLDDGGRGCACAVEGSDRGRGQPRAIIFVLLGLLGVVHGGVGGQRRGPATRSSSSSLASIGSAASPRSASSWVDSPRTR